MGEENGTTFEELLDLLKDIPEDNSDNGNTNRVTQRDEINSANSEVDALLEEIRCLMAENKRLIRELDILKEQEKSNNEIQK